MPIKKKKISELTLADSMAGLYTIGVKMVNGVQTSVKVSLEFIKKAYDDVIAATKKAVDAATAADNSRKQIEANEITRQSAETSRINAEKNRASAETSRVSVEKNRVSAETSRVVSETSRTKAETSRVEAETSRVDTEKLRVTAETSRVDAETSRVSVEKNRVTEFATIKKNAETATSDANDAVDRLNTLSDHRDEIRDGYWWRWDETTGEWYNTGEIAKGNVMYATFEVTPSTAILTMITDEEYTGANFELDENGILTVVIQ